MNPSFKRVIAKAGRFALSLVALAGFVALLIGWLSLNEGSTQELSAEETAELEGVVEQVRTWSLLIAGCVLAGVVVYTFWSVKKSKGRQNQEGSD